ncbi:MAG: outer membrane lipoprotein carrier protein LolA, partial [Treponema sp.]|nr:outer membrane lipoprotein carrier protein LolA [Treponema sp.]
MKKTLSLAILISLFLFSPSFSQGILTASSFFKSVSDNYSTIKDYEADIDIKASKANMSGHLSYK